MDLNIESLVYTRIKNKVTKNLISKYPDINFTTINKTKSGTKYPSVYVHMMESSERGTTLEATEIEGVLSSFQIDIYDNQSQSRTKDVATEIMKVAKEMRFQMVGFPYNNNTDSLYRMVIRIRRMICDDDIL